MNIKFEVTDKTRRKIRMTNWNWEHIVRRHPDISSEKEKIIETLENPNKIINSIRDEFLLDSTINTISIENLLTNL